MGDLPNANVSVATGAVTGAFADATAGNATTLLDFLDIRDPRSLNKSDWDAFYSRFTERQPGACLNPETYGNSEMEGENYGDEITFFIRIFIAAVVTARFLVCASFATLISQTRHRTRRHFLKALTHAAAPDQVAPWRPE